MSKKTWRLFLPVLSLFLSCEKAIRFRPIEQSPKLVVEAAIENDRYPVVVLSSSLDYFSKISIQKLSETFVRNADITVSNGSLTQKLKEYAQPVGNGYTLYYYTVDSAGPATLFKGKPGTAYSLKIVTNNKEYTASTTIPELTKKISLLYFKTGVDRKDSSKVTLFGRFSDPPGLGNYVRYFTRVNDAPFYPGLNSVFDDQIIDGKTYDIQIDQGVDRNRNIDFNDYAFFHKGDSIEVKLCNIDKGVFDFWRTMEYSYSSIGNPFSSPTKVTGNISDGALGYFGGYAVQYSSISIPE